VPAEIPLEEIALADKPWLCELPQQEQALLCLDIAAAVESLPEEQRVAVGLTAGQDISYEEAARAIGVPVGTFRSRLSRGRERLRQMIYRDEDRPTGTDRARVMEYARA